MRPSVPVFAVFVALAFASPFAATALGADLKVGERASLRSVNFPNRVLTVEDSDLTLSEVDEQDFSNATFLVVAGLAGNGSVSLQLVTDPTVYWRHDNGRVVAQADDGSAAFRKDASFYARPGLASGSDVSFEAVNAPNSFIRNRYFQAMLAPKVESPVYRADASFTILAPLAPANFTLALVPAQAGGFLRTNLFSCDPGAQTCSGGYSLGARVTIEAIATAGYSLAIWTGDCSAQVGPTCSLIMTRNRSVGATFTANDQTRRQIVAQPPSHGIIASEYFSCDLRGTSCEAAVPIGVTRDLDAIPDSGYVFDAWGGDCVNQPTSVCSLVFDRDHAVSATFKPAS